MQTVVREAIDDVGPPLFQSESPLSWKKLRIQLFPILGTAFVLLGAAARAMGFDADGSAILVVFGAFGGLMALLVVFDVFYHAIRGEQQPCSKCGEPRALKSFRIHAACPNCGAG